MANQWAKGCGIGCAGCALAILAIVTLVVTLTPGVVDQARSVIDRQQWFAQWQGPSPDAPVDEVLPLHVEERSRGEVTSGEGPELIGFEGQTMLHATYRGDEGTIEVWATRATDEERDRYFERASAAIDSADTGLVTRSLIGQVLTLRYGRPSTSIGLWWGDEWLFTFAAEDGVPLARFPDELLHAIERPEAVPEAEDSTSSAANAAESVLWSEDPLSDATAERVLERLGTPRVTPDPTGLESLYHAWCVHVPFDNLRKLAALERADRFLPGATAEDFFEHWLEHGTGGTCWPTSNALFSLVRHCGFEARRISGSMMDAGVPNHGSVVARVDGQDWLVDSSILSYRPLALRPGTAWQSEIDLYPVRVEPSERSFLIWFPGFGGEPRSCRLLDGPVDHGYYLERYEASREGSVFNDRLCARRHFADRIVGLLGDGRFDVTSAGIEHGAIERTETERGLRDEMGFSSEAVAGLPDSAMLPWQH